VNVSAACLCKLSVLWLILATGGSDSVYWHGASSGLHPQAGRKCTGTHAWTADRVVEPCALAQRQPSCKSLLHCFGYLCPHNCYIYSL
jgi:hypothetical protein